jgi:hypothetical protein
MDARQSNSGVFLGKAPKASAKTTLGELCRQVWRLAAGRRAAIPAM